MPLKPANRRELLTNSLLTVIFALLAVAVMVGLVLLVMSVEFQ